MANTSTGYSASYDAAGEETCRAPTSSQTCSGTPTGQSLTYDALNRMIAWQNAQSNPTSTAYDAYDGEGQSRHPEHDQQWHPDRHLLP